MRNRHVLVCLGSMAAAAFVLIPPSTVLAAGGSGAWITTIQVSSGETKTVPSNAIDFNTRVAYTCSAGGYARVWVAGDKSKGKFTCGQDPKVGEINCPNSGETMTIQRGVFCSRP